jgi:hypothetical protein
MAMGPDLAEHWTTASNGKQISAWAEKLATDAIGVEFGLSIALRGFRRLDTNADVTAQISRDAHHAVVREAARGDAENALQYERDERKALDKNHLDLIASLGRREKEALDDPESKDGDTVAERLRKELQRGATRPRLTSERASAALKPQPSALAAKELPWAPRSDAPEESPPPDPAPKHR